MSKKQKRLFCEINPTCYAISQEKEIWKRRLRDLLGHDTFARTIGEARLPNLVSSYSSGLIKRGAGIDPTLQENKAVNIQLACAKISGMLIRPGEVFSFCRTVGKPTKRRGYRDGRVIAQDRLIPGSGGGLCNLGNTVHRLVLFSPLDTVEVHYHSDALAPDKGARVPFTAGTSISYNYIDYRFQNNTDQVFQLLVWCENERLCGELRSERPIPWTYELVEEGHHFQKEGDKYYRVSKIYRQIYDRETGKPQQKELVWDNHSEVMFDYSLIPQDQLRDAGAS